MAAEEITSRVSLWCFSQGMTLAWHVLRATTSRKTGALRWLPVKGGACTIGKLLDACGIGLDPNLVVWVW